MEYGTREAGQRARAQLDGKLYEGHTLASDWLDASIVTAAGLHSKLLYVDGLPLGFRDMGQFRKLFSQVAHPPYCQVGLASRGMPRVPTTRELGARPRFAACLPACQSVLLFSLAPPPIFILLLLWLSFPTLSTMPER